MKKDVFISYHTDSSKEMVERITRCLEENGVSCWYAPRDVVSSYASSIVKAISGCRVFLLILNECSNESEHVLNEINCAFERFRRKEEIVLLPFRTGNCDLSCDMSYYIGRIHIMNGVLPPEEIRIQELVDRILNLLGKSRQRELTINIGAEQSRRENYRLISTRPSLDPLFVGRQKEIRRTLELLSGSANKVALVGMGGIGKSEIAKNIIWQSADRYDLVVWLSFKDSLMKTVIDDYSFEISGLSREDYPADSDEAYFRRKMRIFRRIADRRVLVLVDNFDVEEDPDLEAFCQGEYAVLFTSRCDQEDNRLAQVTVSRLETREELMEVFCGEYRRRLSPAETDAAYEIVRYLDGHTLAIRLAAACMRTQRITPANMLQMLRGGHSRMARDERAMEGFYGKLDQIYQAAELSDEELLILKNLSLLPLSGVSVTDFCDWCDLDGFDAIDSLIRRNWIVHDQVLDTMHLHPLVGDMMLRQLRRDVSCCETMVNSLYSACLEAYDMPYSEKLEMYSYISCVSARLPLECGASVTARIGSGVLLNELGRLEESVEVYRGIDPAAVPAQMQVIVYTRLAHSLALGGHPEESWEAAQTGRTVYLKLTEEERASRSVMLSANWLVQRLCESTRWQGEYDLAAHYGQEAVNMIGRHLSPRDKDVVWSRYHYAFALLMQRRYEQSEQQLQEAMAVFSGEEGAFFRLCCAELLSQVKMLRGEYREALALLDEYAGVLQQRYEKPHMDVARNLMYYGNVHRRLGDPDTAADYYGRAADIVRDCQPHKEDAVRGLAGDRRLLMDLYGMLYM